MAAIITENKDDKVEFGFVEELPETKFKNGFLYKLVKKGSKAAMYSQQFDKIKTGVKKGIIGYEVFKIVVTKPSAIQQKHGINAGKWYHMASKEKFPGNEDFGKIAWAYNSFEAANKKFIEIAK